MKELTDDLKRDLLKRISNWFDGNYMVLNPDKCYIMISGDKKQTFDLIHLNNKIKYSQEEKVLRTTIDNTLNFKSHIKKLNQKLHAVTRIKHFLNRAYL